MICKGCGGILGRDCYNEIECIGISNSMESDQRQMIEYTYEAIKKQDKIINIFHEAFTLISQISKPGRTNEIILIAGNAIKKVSDIDKNEQNEIVYSNDLPF